MNNERNDIDDLFRDRLGNFSLDVPEHVWKGIDARRTPLYRAINYFKNRKGVSIASLLLLVAISSAIYLHQQQNPLQAKNSFAQANTQKSTGIASIQNVPLSNEANNTLPTANFSEQNNSTSQKNSFSTASKNAASGSEITSNNPGKNEGSSPTLPTDEIINTKKSDEFVTETALHSLPTTSTPTAIAENETDIITTATDNIPTVDEPTATQNQQKNLVKPPHTVSKFSFDVYTGITHTGETIAANGVAQNYITAKQKTERYMPGLSTGIRLNYQANKILTLRAGIQYTRINQRLKFENELPYTRITNTVGYILDPITQQPIGTVIRTDTATGIDKVSASANNTITFIDLPLQLEWKLWRTQKLNVFATTGAAVNLSFTQKGQLINKDLTGLSEINNNNNPFKPNAGINILAGAGISYQLCNSSEVLFETTYSQGINNVMNTNAGMRQNFSMFSGSLGLRFRF